ncbi:AraC-like DNA-binding protein [Actinoplanes lutulentus]|uniref:AraC family transcriptional regulator n=1 Tax=Actinoplanes lutulentus TaxID=1287878 RepID=A0A327Z5Z8_9ACTN|nr:helix-turn-helix domain-containing protein [Actinoplanes lutulentus]MBB2947081.1 AraC-like DNA-binding protein [Actinoplanes lutulentus]RAK30578.1 AraC family transcriptional regulator [Actinoplanes lutulentus]
MNRLIEFSTAGLPAEQRIALWEDHNRSALIGLRCRMLSESLFDGTEINLQLDRMHVARVRGNAHVVERPAEVIRRNPADAIAVYLAVAGEAFFYHDDGVVTLRPGQVLICDADRPFLRGFSRGLEEIAIKVPRATFREVSGLDELRAPLVREDLSARTLAKLAGRALRDPAADEATLLSLLAAMVNPGHEVGAAHLANAHAFIDDHLTEIGLNAPRVAGAIGVSERHLSRLFAASGVSLPRFVLSRRLERAHALLTASPGATIAGVAAACGFGSATHFSHAFRARFGLRASEVRARHAR